MKTNKTNYLAVLFQDDYDTIVLALEREQSSITNLLNSGNVKSDVQDKVLRDREYKISKLLDRLTNN